MLQNINLEDGKGLGQWSMPKTLSLVNEMMDAWLFSLGYL